MKRTRLPSPAMVVAITALFVALGGTGYAATTLSTQSPTATVAKKHKAKPPANDTKPDTTLVNQMAPGLSVKFAKSAGSAGSAGSASHAGSADSATNANHASSADNATNATNATNASNAQPVAFGRETSSSAQDVPNSKNVTITGGPSPYCLSGIPFTPRGGQATADANGFGGGDYATFGLGKPASCPAGTQAFVDIWNPGSPPSLTDDGFFVTVYG